MKTHLCTQGSLDWLEARCAIPTASEFNRIVTDKFEPRKGEMPRTYLAEKLAEKWCGPLPGFTAWATEQGSLLEEVAIPWLELERGIEVERIGFITTDDGRIGCSPDGIIGKTGIEVKCPQAPHQIKSLLSGEVPSEYLCQIHGGMLVTGFDCWTFLSYHRTLPKLLLEVPRDESIQDKLRMALDVFLKTFDEEWQRLCDKNGGPPPKRKVFVPSPESEENPYVEVGITP
jgi:hypothetical protein